MPPSPGLRLSVRRRSSRRVTAEINASIARVAAVRLKAFEQARNAEIDTSIARVEARRALLETGAISKPDPHTARTHAWPVPQRDTSS